MARRRTRSGSDREDANRLWAQLARLRKKHPALNEALKVFEAWEKMQALAEAPPSEPPTLAISNLSIGPTAADPF